MQAAKRLQATIDSAAHKYPTVDWQQNQDWLRVVEMGKQVKVAIMLIMPNTLPLLAHRLVHNQALLVSAAVMSPYSTRERCSFCYIAGDTVRHQRRSAIPSPERAAEQV